MAWQDHAANSSASQNTGLQTRRALGSQCTSPGTSHLDERIGVCPFIHTWDSSPHTASAARDSLRSTLIPLIVILISFQEGKKPGSYTHTHTEAPLLGQAQSQIELTIHTKFTDPKTSFSQINTLPYPLIKLVSYRGPQQCILYRHVFRLMYTNIHSPSTSHVHTLIRGARWRTGASQ